VYAYRALGLGDKAERYKAGLLSINPYTTLYRDSAGEGDLNLETAVITLLALYSTQKPTHDTALVVVTVVLVVVAVASIILALRHLLLKHYIYSRTRRQHVTIMCSTGIVFETEDLTVRHFIVSIFSIT
jgi:hypothetical protein